MAHSKESNKANHTIDNTIQAPKELEWLQSTAELLDNRFRIPGTKIRFGLDSLMGLIPYAGDVFTFLIGGLLIIVMYRKGASGRLVLKMLGNLWVDGVIGTVPILGDIFDFRYRANLKNVNLMVDYYEEGKHWGKNWGMVFLIIVTLTLLIGASLFVVWRVLKWLLI